MRPCAVARTMSSEPDETATQARASSSPTVSARMPVERTRSKRSMGVFLTMPATVAMTRLCPGSKSGSVMTARTRSPDSTWTPSRLMMGMPLACREASGTACTLELKTRPRSVKKRAQSWVLATRRCATASSSTVRAPMMPLPPRAWRR